MGLTITGIRYGGYFHGMTVVSDRAVGLSGDKLSFHRYTNPLISVLTDPGQETPFTIGIFGSWGSGKSSLLRMLEERLQMEHAEEFVCVAFNPWVHRSEENMLVPLLHTLRDALNRDQKARFVESGKKIFDVLMRLGADVLLKKITTDAVSLEKIEALEKKYIQSKHLVESEMRNLHKTLQDLLEEIHGQDGKPRLVLLIDDLDRCEPDQIISLLDSVKLFLDLQHVFVILAVDREVVHRGIQVRYSKFSFAAGREETVGYEYLEKMIQLPIELFPLSPAQVDTLALTVFPNAEHAATRDLIKKVALPNPRKIKRLMNIFAVVRALKNAEPSLSSLNEETVLRLIALQVQYPELYWEVARLPVALEALAKVYCGELLLSNPAAFLEYKGLADALRKLCTEYHKPGSNLEQIFKNSRFVEFQGDLPRYLSMLGGPSSNIGGQAEQPSAPGGTAGGPSV